MGAKLVALGLHNLATQDQYDEVGRIFVADARVALGRPDLTVDGIISLLTEFYPGETAESPQPNLVLVYFYGKESTRELRSRRAPVTPDTIPETDGEETFSAQQPTIYRKADYAANNPEDNIL